MAKNPNIETYHGRRPCCLFCGKKLMGNYTTVRADSSTTKISRVFDTEPADVYVEWSDERQKWFEIKKVRKVISRKFKGTFGPYGNGFFCSVLHGYYWATGKCKQERDQQNQNKRS